MKNKTIDEQLKAIQKMSFADLRKLATSISVDIYLNPKSEEDKEAKLFKTRDELMCDVQTKLIHQHIFG